MAVRQIPKRLLIHTIEYSEIEGSNGWDDSFKAPIIIKNVRVSPSFSVNRTANSEGQTISHVVFVDRVHSSIFPKFKKKSKIKWEGETYELSEVKPYYDFNDEPHHYELELS
jgi:Minor capsid protein